MKQKPHPSKDNETHLYLKGEYEIILLLKYLFIHWFLTFLARVTFVCMFQFPLDIIHTIIYK